jgi:hypothetical protein
VLADRGVKLAEQWSLFDWIGKLGIPTEAFRDLRTDACRQFNDTTPDAREVRYFSVAGDKKREEMLFPRVLPAAQCKNGTSVTQTAPLPHPCSNRLTLRSSAGRKYRRGKRLVIRPVSLSLT